MTPEQQALASIDVSLRRIATALEAIDKREINRKQLLNSTYGKLGRPAPQPTLRLKPWWKRLFGDVYY